MAIFGNDGTILHGLKEKIQMQVVAKEEVEKAFRIFYSPKDDINLVTIGDILDANCVEEGLSVSEKISKSS